MRERQDRSAGARRSTVAGCGLAYLAPESTKPASPPALTRTVAPPRHPKGDQMPTAIAEPPLGRSRGRVPWWWWPSALLALLVAAYSLRYVVVGERAYIPELAPSF